MIGWLLSVNHWRGNLLDFERCPLQNVPMTPDDLSKLIMRIALRDRAAFDQLYQQTSAKLFGVCLRVLKDRSAAEEALQEVFVKIWTKADRFAVTELSPISWLVAVARNHAIDQARRVPQPASELDDIVDSQVHIHWVGEPVGLKTAGAVLMHLMESIHVRGKVRDMPEEIAVDVSGLQANGTIHISDLDIPSELEYLGEEDDAVVSITIQSEEAEEGTEGEEIGSASAEPEVITEKKEQEDEG